MSSSTSLNSADCVTESDRFKFIDDLSVLEIVNLLTVGLTSFNLKHQIPSDIPQHNQYIPPDNLKSQQWLNNINDWTVKQKMLINEKKTKTMIFNCTNKCQFTTRLNINNQPIEVIDSTKLLGTVLSNDLCWDLNTANLVKKANERMQLLRKVASFGTNWEELKNIYVLFVRSLLEQSATVWLSSLTEENKTDLERVQKTALKLILEEKYITYKHALRLIDLENLSERTENLCLAFALKTSKNEKFRDMFPLKSKEHPMNTRKPEKFEVQHAHTECLKQSTVIFMQNLLNDPEHSK